MTKRKTTAAELAKTSGQVGKPSAVLPVGYANLLTDLKARVRAAQLRAAVSVNRELILLYWDIGKIIVEAQKTKGYGKQVVERLAVDLQKEFPGTAGFSPQNVWFMRSFYPAWPAMPQKLSQPVRESATSAPPAPISELPWGHNRLLLTKLELPPSASGMATRPSNMAGHAKCSRTTSKRNCTSAKAKPSPILSAPCRPWRKSRLNLTTRALNKTAN
jgi:hypothetical protein